MRPPDFWRRDEGLWPTLLQPLSLIWRVATVLKQASARPYKSSVPVICVGNLGVGGAGKTPVALAIGARLSRANIKPHFLTRGYGGRRKGPLQVDPARHSAKDVGDEALLLAAAAPTWVGPDRGATARLAIAAGAGALVMDDGFQNMTLAKDLSLIVVDQDYGFGNGRVLPAGPLREPVAQGLTRASGVIVLDGSSKETPLSTLPPGLGDTTLPVIPARLEPRPGSETMTGTKVVAFAGIGRPDKFFATLEFMGCDIIERHTFDDHHFFSADEIMRIVERAAALGARPVTTAKDAVRLTPEARPMIDVLNVGVEFVAPETLDQLLQPIIERAGGTP
jgi:tetraacyldisaccharide 4'-kinase